MRSDQASILVVDDELELLEIFSAWLGRNGYRVFTAPNGAEALNVLARKRWTCSSPTFACPSWTA